MLSRRHQKSRVEFARKHLHASFSNVIFSDEKIFRVRPGGVVRCWRKISHSKYDARYVMPTTQKPAGLMVWAAMKSNGRVIVKRCPHRMNAPAYQSVLQKAIRFIKPRSSITLRCNFTDCQRVSDFSKTVLRAIVHGQPLHGFGQSMSHNLTMGSGQQ